MTTSSEWVALNFITGEIGSAVEPPKRTRRADAAFTALVKLCGFEGEALTDIDRGKLNKARGGIVKVERQRKEDVTLEEIAELIAGFLPWFKTYRRERFNENCRRDPYPMETLSCWTYYRKAPVEKSWNNTQYEQAKNTPGTAAYRLAHRHDDEAETSPDEPTGA